jgi:hypothetical protein
MSIYTLIQIPIFINDVNGQKEQNKEYLRIFNDYLSLIKGFNPSSDNYFIGGMPVTMDLLCSKQLLRITPSGNFTNYITLKLDGERYILFLSSWGELFFIDRLMNFYIFVNQESQRLPSINGVGRSLLDGEMILFKDGIYEFFIFDVLYYISESFISKDYYTRYDVCKYVINSVLNGYLSSLDKANLTITLKRWFPITDILKTDEIYEYIDSETNKGRLKKYELKADGLIIQPFDTPYITFGPWIGINNVQFKWKPLEHQTMDFKIKIINNSEWELLTKSNYPFTMPGSGIKAICNPTGANKKNLKDSDVAEFKFKYSTSEKTFEVLRSRPNKQANSQGAIMAVLRFISNPFTLDSLKPALNELTSSNSLGDLKPLLSVMSKTDLILCSTEMFFVESKTPKYNEIGKLKNIYSEFIGSGSKNMELEARLYKNGNPGKNMDKITFNYLLEFLSIYFKGKSEITIDIIQKNEFNSKSKYRSSYRSFEDLNTFKSFSNEEKISYSQFDSNTPRKLNDSTKLKEYGFYFDENKLLYNEIIFRMSLSEEKKSNKTIKPGVGNLIRYKERYSFQVSELWILDLTKVRSSYTKEEVENRPETYEVECEFIGPKDTTFEIFLESYNVLYKALICNSTYC